MLTGTVTHLAHRQYHLRRNVHKSWGNARCKRDICAAWAFTRRANGVTQDGAKVAWWTFLKGQREGQESGGCVFTENLHLVCSASAMLTSQRSQWSDWSPSSHGHWAQVLEQCWKRGRKGPGFQEIRYVLEQATSVFCPDFTSQMVQMLHKEPGRNACFSESDSSPPENILHHHFTGTNVSWFLLRASSKSHYWLILKCF